jgi:hypothetical protein
MPKINPNYAPLLRESNHQGLLECFLVTLSFSIALYLQTDNYQNLIQCLCSYALILLELFKSNSFLVTYIQKIYWPALITALYAIGGLYSSIILYVSMEVHLYYRMMGGISKTFTAGELFLNSHILVTLFVYSFNAPDIHTAIILFPVLFSDHV